MLPQIGPDGQKRLSEARVLVVGAGGLGSAAAIYLAGAGVGLIGICDPDTVSVSNLQRQVLYSTAETGQSKAEAAAARLAALNPEIRICTHPEGLTADNADSLAEAYDLIVDCTDNYAARYLTDDACFRAGKPWIYGSIGEFGGQVAMFNGTAGTRYCDLYADRDALCAQQPAVRGVLGAVPGVVGAIEASEAIKYLCGYGSALDGRLFIIDLLTLKTDILEL